MKKIIPFAMILLCTTTVFAQYKKHKFGVNVGSFIQHYNGNLGNSFFKFKTTCFWGVSADIGMYLNKSFDIHIGGTIGDFGYCQTDADAQRFVSMELRCPGCVDRVGMGDLRSLMVSGNVAIHYKFANGFMLKEDSKLAPYLFAGLGINKLSDSMQKNCVNEGYHLTVNGGGGIKYNISDRFNIGYHLGLGCFLTKKVYATNTISEASDDDHDAIDRKFERRKDLYMQNALVLGFNF